MGSVRAFLLVLLLTFATPAFAGAKEDALAVLEKWSQAFAASDVDTIVETYAADALFMGTGSKSDEVVLITGLNASTGVRDGVPSAIQAASRL